MPFYWNLWNAIGNKYSIVSGGDEEEPIWLRDAIGREIMEIISGGAEI